MCWRGDGFVLLGHVVLEGLGDDRAVDDRQLLQLLAAHAQQPAVDRARRPAATSRRLDDRGGAGHEVAAGEHAVDVGLERVGVDDHLPAVQLELQGVVLRAIRPRRRGAVQRRRAPRGHGATVDRGAGIGHAQVAVELGAVLAEHVVVRRLAGAGDDHVARDRELAAGDRLRRAPAGGIGLAQAHPLEDHAGDLAVAHPARISTGEAKNSNFTPSKRVSCCSSSSTTISSGPRR